MLNGIWDNDPEGYESLRDSWLNAHRTDRVKRFLSSAQPGQKILEIGCGTGALLREIGAAYPDNEFFGIDPISSYVDFAVSKADSFGLKNVAYLNGSAEDLGDNPSLGNLDFIVSTDVIHHISDIDRSLKSVSRIASRNARWLAIEPSRLNPYISYSQATAPGERNFYPRSFLSSASKYGWKKVSVRYFTLIPAFIKNPPNALKLLESVFEWCPCLAGRVAIVLEYRPDNQADHEGEIISE